MAEKIITIKQATKKSKDDNEWVELVDAENKTHRIFGSIQDNDGNWHHFENDFDTLLTSEGRAIKLIKEKKGNFWNVIGFELVQNVFVEEAQKAVEDKDTRARLRSVVLSYAKDIGITRDWSITTILQAADIFYCWLEGGQIPDETKTSKETEQAKIIKAVPIDETRPISEQVPVTNAKELMAWALSHGKQFGPSWVRKTGDIPAGAVITDEMAVGIYYTVKELQGWED